LLLSKINKIKRLLTASSQAHFFSLKSRHFQTEKPLPFFRLQLAASSLLRLSAAPATPPLPLQGPLVWPTCAKAGLIPGIKKAQPLG
jgi:hypothetical protein